MGSCFRGRYSISIQNYFSLRSSRINTSYADGIRTVKTNGSTIHHYTLNGSQVVTDDLPMVDALPGDVTATDAATIGISIGATVAKEEYDPNPYKRQGQKSKVVRTEMGVGRSQIGNHVITKGQKHRRSPKSIHRVKIIESISRASVMRKSRFMR